MGNAAKNEYGLTEKQAAFCSEFVSNGGQKEKAALAAGYAESSARTRAYELLQRTCIQAKIREITRNELSSLGAEALNELRKLMVSAKSESVRQLSATAILDRSGYKHPEVIEIDNHRSIEDVDRELAILLGLDIQGESAEEVH